MIYHGDCLEILPRLIPTASVDLILCDPPYGITSAGFDCEIDLHQLWPQLWRIAKPYCPVVLSAAQPFSSVVTVSQIDNFKAVGHTLEKNDDQEKKIKVQALREPRNPQPLWRSVDAKPVRDGKGSSPGGSVPSDCCLTNGHIHGVCRENHDEKIHFLMGRHVLHNRAG